jgi:hypothetical protein
MTPHREDRDIPATVSRKPALVLPLALLMPKWRRASPMGISIRRKTIL